MVFIPVQGSGKVTRPLNQRALRSFTLIYKEPYGDQEIASLFRETIDNEASNYSEENNDMLSLLELTINSYIKLYTQLKGYFYELEKSWLNLSLQKFMDCLRSVGKFRMMDNLEINEFLKV